jgi:hypothetical protein
VLAVARQQVFAEAPGPVRRLQTGSVRTKASFRLWGDNARLTAEAVSHKLGLEPTRAAEAGDRGGRRSDARRGESLWLLSSGRGAEVGVEVAEQLGRLLGVLEPVAGALWELVDAGYEANWYCWVESHATEHAVEIDRQLMQPLLALPGDLWLDVCGDGEDADPTYR